MTSTPTGEMVDNKFQDISLNSKKNNLDTIFVGILSCSPKNSLFSKKIQNTDASEYLRILSRSVGNMINEVHVITLQGMQQSSVKL